MINPAIFRAYDIRGNAHKDLSANLAYKIGFSFAKIISSNNKKNQNIICVARDGRLSSKDLCNNLLQGIRASGTKIKYLGIASTPLLYFADKIFAASGSIMVTGSHNPKDDNGFKMLKEGTPFFGEMIQHLKKELASFNQEDIKIEKNDKEEEITDIKEKYLERILLNRKINKDCKIAFDPANGSGSELTSMLCKKLPCESFIINEKIDGNFPSHPPDPTIAKNLQQLKKVVLNNNCDIGIGFDGDADRIGVITKKGRFIHGDQLLCLYAKNILTKIPKAKIIADVKSSQSFFDYVEKSKGTAIMCKTGHSFIKTKMNETGAHLAGEMSGHIFFADEYYGYDDALYAAVRLIDIISNSLESIDNMVEKLPKMYNTPEIKIKVSDEKKFAIIDNVKLMLRSQNIDFIDIDGLRVNSTKGWWLLRASNTGPAIIARCESYTKNGLKHIKNDLAKILLRYDISIT